MMHLLISVSGGRTSLDMARQLQRDYSTPLVKMHFVFANTGKEDEKTLRFVDDCDRTWEMGIVWVEAVVHPGEKKGCTHRIVTFDTASRNGEPFEEVIKKYGIPNKKYLHCTRELKLNPIRSYMQSIGVPFYFTAVGMRIDEPKRLRKDAAKKGIIYPMATMFPTTKPEVMDWWEDQEFQLDLPEHRGNCTTCHKKSLKKLVMVAQETPEEFEFNARMEEEYGLAGHNVDGTPRTFFRENRSTKDIISISQLLGQGRANALDVDSGCSESCEPF